jgi:hypothetical protein
VQRPQVHPPRLARIGDLEIPLASHGSIGCFD